MKCVSCSWVTEDDTHTHTHTHTHTTKTPATAHTFNLPACHNSIATSNAAASPSTREAGCVGNNTGGSLNTQCTVIERALSGSQPYFSTLPPAMRLMCARGAALSTEVSMVGAPTLSKMMSAPAPVCRSSQRTKDDTNTQAHRHTGTYTKTRTHTTQDTRTSRSVPLVISCTRFTTSSVL